MLLLSVVLAFLVLAWAPVGRADENWRVFVDPAIAAEPAIRAALEDLQSAGKNVGVEFREVSGPPERFDSLIVVGSSGTAPIVSQLVRTGTIRLDPLGSDQAYQIQVDLI